MDCYNYNCPMRTSIHPTSRTRCDCTACPNRSDYVTYYASDHTVPQFTDDEWAKICRISSPLADIEDYKAFFSVFNVFLQNEDGSYKNTYDVLNEASKKYHKRLDLEYERGT